MSERELLPPQMLPTTPKTSRNARIVLEVIVVSVSVVCDRIKFTVEFLLPNFELCFRELQWVILVAFDPFQDVIQSLVSI